MSCLQRPKRLTQCKGTNMNQHNHSYAKAGGLEPSEGQTPAALT